MRLPAVCDSCGTLFESGIEVVNSSNITLEGVGWGPCPNCGGDGHIPDGVYSVMGRALEVLAAHADSLGELRRFEKLLREARDASAEVLRKRVRSETPGLASLADLVPETKSDRIAFISMLIAAVALIVQVSQGGEKPSNITVNQVFNQVIVQQHAPPPKTGNYTKEKRRAKKGERNARRK